MMVGACLVPLITLALALAPDVASLVARLGAGTVAEREESAKQLEAMGREALPALEAALRSPDAEVRSRVLSVWERIQKGLMVRPTMVRLEGQGRPLHEVVRSIGEQGGFSLRASQQGPERLFDAREPVTIPFWEAVDRLGLGGGHFDIANPIGGHFPTLELGGFKAGYPSAISGPFRITLNGLHDHRDRLLIGGPWLNIDEMSQRISIPRTAGEREARFYIELGMMIEPRMWFTQEGPARAIEAVDDLGQSLVRRDATRVKADHSLSHNDGGVTQGQFQLDLAMPDNPGRSIVRLRGSIPVAIQIRRPVPDLEIPLSAPVGQTFAHEDGVFTLREVRESDQGTLINLNVRINFDRFDLPAGRDGEIITSRLQCLNSHQIEIVDADGRVLAEAGGGGMSPDGNARISLMVWKNGNKTRPARLRYYGMVRAVTDVAFEFRNIPMP
jgi:hypothetical protein